MPRAKGCRRQDEPAGYRRDEVLLAFRAGQRVGLAIVDWVGILSIHLRSTLAIWRIRKGYQ
jgi:hypothetical protein